jgi:hypothetical protein
MDISNAIQGCSNCLFISSLVSLCEQESSSKKQLSRCSQKSCKFLYILLLSVRSIMGVSLLLIIACKNTHIKVKIRQFSLSWFRRRPMTDERYKFRICVLLLMHE